MGCATCSKKKKKNSGVPAGCNNNGNCGANGCGSKLDVQDWLQNVRYVEEDLRDEKVEIRFKGTRKEYGINTRALSLEIGDLIMVQTQTGIDAGYVSMKGPLVKLQMKKRGIKENSESVVTILRKAHEKDISTYKEAKSRELPTMYKTRRIAKELGLVMKISDIEFQADNRKATFFYTADGRVDFRELIKHLAKEFRVKIEMRQIGLRQEAGRLGGIGDCGRELCCSTWLTDFNTVSTSAAKAQNLFLNPLKLSGQCGRLKCCLNYELDVYLEALENFPREDTILKTKAGNARVAKTDILKGTMVFSIQNKEMGINNYYNLTIDDVNKVIKLNKNGKIPEDLSNFAVIEEKPAEKEIAQDIIEESSLTRFEKNKRKKSKRKGKSRNKRRRPPGNKKSS